MIYTVLKLIANELDDYVKQQLNLSASTEKEVILGNIANLETDANTLGDKLVMSLVNLQEETSLRNVRQPVTVAEDNSLHYQNPPVNVNLYVLLGANYITGPDAYGEALKRLSIVLRYFQSKKEFWPSNLPNRSDLTFEPGELDRIRVKADLYTMSFEQVNHLWGSLGGKQVPFVMYRMRFLEIQALQDQAGGGIITEVELNN